MRILHAQIKLTNWGNIFRFIIITYCYKKVFLEKKNINIGNENNVSLKDIVSKGEGAYYSSGSRPNQTAKSWGYARLASSITGGNASVVDMHILEKECSNNSKALKLAKNKSKLKKPKVKKVQIGGSKTKPKMAPGFTPNLTPRQMFLLGSFGGTYWRPIYSSVTDTNYENIHKQYPKSWWKSIPEENLSSTKYDKNKNKYKVKVGTTLSFWEGKNWITKYNPYGWVHWYCDYYNGKRSPDDERQINRWKALAGPNGRFRKWLVTMILKKNGKWDDFTISPKIRQTLQHWGYKLTKKDFDNEVKNRK